MMFNLRDKSKELQTLYLIPVSFYIFLIFSFILLTHVLYGKALDVLFHEVLDILLITPIVLLLIFISMDLVSYVLKRFMKMNINTLSQIYLLFRWMYAHLLFIIYCGPLFNYEYPLRTILLYISPIFFIIPSISVHYGTINCIKKRDELKFKKCIEAHSCKTYIQLLPKPGIVIVCDESVNTGEYRV